MVDDRSEDDMTEPAPEDLERLRHWLHRAPVEPLDEVTRRRLVRTAVAAADVPGDVRTAPTEPRLRRLRLVPALAAAAVFVVAVGAGVVSVFGDREPTLGALDRSAVEEVWQGDLGAVDRAEVTGGVVAAPGADADVEVPAGVVRCVARVLDERELVAVAAALFGSSEAYLVEMSGEDGRVVLVLARDDCRLLDRIEVR